MDWYKNSGPPAEVSTRLEANVLAAYKQRHRVRRRWSRVAVPMGIAASLVVASWLITTRRELHGPQPVAPAPASVIAQQNVNPPPTARVPAPKATRRKAVARKRKQAAEQLATTQPVRKPVSTEFIQLPYAPVFFPPEGGQIIRVRLPRSSMRSVGLPVNEERAYERVQAEVLMGSDGIARAIRFVR